VAPGPNYERYKTWRCYGECEKANLHSRLVITIVKLTICDLFYVIASKLFEIFKMLAINNVVPLQLIIQFVNERQSI